MIVIATDEAGYGPKLGPLVIVGSVWKLPTSDSEASTASAFTPLTSPVQIGAERLTVGDSKQVFQSRSKSGRHGGGYRKLEWMTLAGCRWSGLITGELRPVADLAPADAEAVWETPWLASLAQQRVAVGAEQALLDAWSTGPAQLIGLQARVITARVFNELCRSGLNKSDLLSLLTLRLVRELMGAVADLHQGPIHVDCDRHGGRRYYAAPLQSVFPDALPEAVSQSKTTSHYRVPRGDSGFEIRFSVKGDSYAPVAYSSIVAKYLREKSMEAINAYFAAQHRETEPLRPTAGYGSDANRFLRDVEPILGRTKLKRNHLVRCR
jgi:hypothetical protein